MRFVRENFDYKFQLDPLQYRAAKDLYKKKNWQLFVPSPPPKRMALKTVVVPPTGEKGGRLAAFLNKSLSPPSTLNLQKTEAEAWRQLQSFHQQVSQERVPTQSTPRWRLKEGGTVYIPRGGTGQTASLSWRGQGSPRLPPQSPPKPTEPFSARGRVERGEEGLTSLQKALKKITHSPQMIKARYYNLQLTHR